MVHYGANVKCTVKNVYYLAIFLAIKTHVLCKLTSLTFFFELLQYWEKCKNKAQEALKSAQNDIKDLKDDAKTTSLNYEDQLSLMSEHLANMNDRLTNQTDEIERLKYELSNKKSGKR